MCVFVVFVRRVGELAVGVLDRCCDVVLHDRC